MPQDITAAWHKAHHCLFLLDYDGTLSPLKPLPHQAKPAPALLRLLTRLASNPKNTVVIISGRDHKTLEAWLGALPLDFAAEHGLYVRRHGQDWHAVRDTNDQWKAPVKPLLAQYVQQIAGSHVEETTGTLNWHYRTAPSRAIARRAATSLMNELAPLAGLHGLQVLDSNKVVVVKLGGVDKGAVAQHWVKARRWDWILAAGDDTTDEYMFGAMPEQAYTIKIGRSRTVARSRLSSVRALHTLLRSLTS